MSPTFGITIRTFHTKEVNNMRLTKNLGMLLLSIWLIAWGLSALVPALGGLGVILAILAIAAGVFILLGR